MSRTHWHYETRKLTPEQVKAIRFLHTLGIRQSALLSMTSVGYTTINEITRGMRYSEIPDIALEEAMELKVKDLVNMVNGVYTED